MGEMVYYKPSLALSAHYRQQAPDCQSTDSHTYSQITSKAKGVEGGQKRDIQGQGCHGAAREGWIMLDPLIPRALQQPAPASVSCSLWLATLLTQGGPG